MLNTNIECGDSVAKLAGLLNVSAGNNKIIVVGDSISASNTLDTPTGVIANVSNGVCTLTAPAHQCIAGWRFRLYKTTSPELNALNDGYHIISSVVDTNTIRFDAPNVPDGSYTGGYFLNVQKRAGTSYINVQSQLGGGYSVTENEAMSGDGINDILSRIHVITSNKEIGRVHLMAGTNDILRNIDDLQVIQANYTEVVSKILQSGKAITLSTIPPINDAVGLQNGDTIANRNKRLVDLNNFIARFNNSRMITVVSGYNALVDTATGDYKASYSYDGVHLSPLGNYVFGDALYKASKLPVIESVYSNSATDYQVVSNGLFINAGGVASTGITGDIPAGFSAQRTGELAATSTLQQVGDYKELVFSVNALDAGNRIIVNGPELISRLPIGTKVRIKAFVKSSDWSAVRNFNLLAFVTNAGNIGQVTTGFNNQGSFTNTPYEYLSNNAEIYLESSVFEITAGTTSVTPRIDVTLNSVVDVSISRLFVEVEL